MSRIVWALSLVSMLVLAACESGNDAAAQPSPAAARPEATGVATPAPTSTPSQSSTPTPARTAIPTATPPPAAAAQCDIPGINTVHSGVAKPGELIWSFFAGEGLEVQSPAVTGGIVYFGSGRDDLGRQPRVESNRECGTLFSVSVDDGRELWRFPVRRDTNGPLVSGGLVFFGDDTGDLRAIDATSGVERWRFDAKGPMRSAPAVDDDAVYFASADQFYALDRRTGLERWRASISRDNDAREGLFRSHPLVVDGTVYVGSTDGGLYAFDVRTGVEEWRLDTGDAIYASPAFADGLVYIGSTNGNLYAVSASTGEERWRVRLTQGGSSGGPDDDMRVAGGVVYVNGQGGRVHALDAQTGSEIWRNEGDSAVAPAFAGGVLYVGGGRVEKHLRALDARSGEELWRVETTDFVTSPLVVVDGVIYFATRDNSVHAVAAE